MASTGLGDHINLLKSINCSVLTMYPQFTSSVRLVSDASVENCPALSSCACLIQDNKLRLVTTCWDRVSDASKVNEESGEL